MVKLKNQQHYFIFFRVTALCKLWALKTCIHNITKNFLAKGLKICQLIVVDGELFLKKSLFF